ncbi:Crp/Fnr family transcriptional regulator [Mucilaginibacter calamicampi]|uniref:Crp/Fnr family transcriptional regulator n=1 Tax=Mucilaginibacter calamicampi TaxID=1302352 RepID=A0ABW2YUE7_9SPHI
MTEFFNNLNLINSLSENAQSDLITKLKRAEYQKGEILIKELSKCDHLFFIEKGLARARYFKDGRDITDWFAGEGSVIGPIIRHLPIKIGTHDVELLEDTSVITIHFQDLQELYDKHHEIERLGRIIAIQAVFLLQQKIDSIQFFTAKQRYNEFVKANPTLLQRVSLGHIASYLGMNQVTLSRIRKK